MRPLRLIGIHAPTSGKEDVLHAWQRLNEWVLRKSLSHDVEIGYGLVGVGDGGSGYCVAIEQPEAVTAAEANELARMSLPGGAYRRSRFKGPLDAIQPRLEEMVGALGPGEHTRLDTHRPLVSILLDIKSAKAGEEVRSNLLIPVCCSELSKSPQKAA